MENLCELCQYYSPSGCAKLSNETCIKDAFQLIKENATNGDVFELLLNNDEHTILRFDENFNYGMRKELRFDKSWWNAPYKV